MGRGLTQIRFGKGVKELNSGRAPGFDGIPAKILLHGANRIAVEIHYLISDTWLHDPVPQDWVDTILISLFKGKGIQIRVCQLQRQL